MSRRLRMQEPAPQPRTKPVALALQGGASLGAYGWGVLDALLEDGRLHFEGVTGASAGAINAVLFADGMAAGGREGARESLRRFWERLAEVCGRRRRDWRWLLRAIRRDLFGLSSTRSFYDLTCRLMSDVYIDPFTMEPLRGVLEETVDFARVRKSDACKVFINATNARTQQPRVFPSHELSVDAVCASACVPLLFAAVQIEGEHYWDGGFLGNPAIYPVLYECETSDVILVETAPMELEWPPTSVTEVLWRLSELSFTAALVRELRTIQFVNHIVEQTGDRLRPRVREVRMHGIASHTALSGVGAKTLFSADLGYFRWLHRLGREAGEGWLEQVFDRIGTESTYRFPQTDPSWGRPTSDSSEAVDQHGDLSETAENAKP